MGRRRTRTRRIERWVVAAVLASWGLPAMGAEVPPELTLRITGGQPELRWQGFPGRRYVVERGASPGGPWQQPGELIAPGSIATWADTEATLPGVNFYRLSWDPNDDGNPGNELFVLPDGDFESGGAPATTGWWEDRPLNNAPLIVQSIPGLPVAARSGTHFAWLGGYHNLGESPNHKSIIQYKQTILVPAPPVYLHLWYQIISSEQPNATGLCEEFLNLWFADVVDAGTFCNTNSIFNQYQICEPVNTNGWTRISADLSAYSGFFICLAFEMRTNFLDISHVLLDDISFRDVP